MAKPEPGRARASTTRSTCRSPCWSPCCSPSSPTSPGRATPRARCCAQARRSAACFALVVDGRRRRSGGSATPFHVLFIFLAALALATNLQKTVEQVPRRRPARRRRLPGPRRRRRHPARHHRLLGLRPEHQGDAGAGRAAEGGRHDAHLHALHPAPRREKERMEVQVARAGGKRYIAYPQLFMNDRTQQVMAHPDIHELPLAGPLHLADRVRPRPAAAAARQGAAGKVGDVEVRFVGFDLNVGGNALAPMQQGRPVTIGAELAVTQGGRTVSAMPLYRLDPADGRGRGPAPRPPRRRRRLRLRDQRQRRRRAARADRRRQPREALDRRHQEAADPARLGRPLRGADRRGFWR